jgi:hypothetical protein
MSTNALLFQVSTDPFVIQKAMIAPICKRQAPNGCTSPDGLCGRLCGEIGHGGLDGAPAAHRARGSDRLGDDPVFTLYVALLLWAFHEQRLARVAAIIWGTAILSAGTVCPLGVRP